ncbi:hypothetical protein FBU30_002965 [Linnemannia zychae]|nr:hypothetical protein FBU30_002965 [Linnemannia zychae]
MDMDKTTTSQSDNHDQNHHLHALDISLIRSLIAADLSKRDLGICLLVCKKWFLDFTPLYWRTIIVQPHRITSYPASIISKYGQHIRVLKAGRIEETSVFNQPSINHLQHLDLSTCGSKDKEDGGRGCLLEIITRNRKGLMSLVWRCFGRDTTMERPFRLWPAMFQGLSELVELDLSNWSLSRVDFLRMLIACPSLRKLTFQAIEDIQESVRRQNPRSGLHSTDESIEMVGTTATGPVSTQDTSQNQSTNSNNRKTPPHDDEHLLGFQHTWL